MTFGAKKLLRGLLCDLWTALCSPCKRTNQRLMIWILRAVRAPYDGARLPTQLRLKQSCEQKKLSLPNLRHVGHWRVPASLGQSTPIHLRFVWPSSPMMGVTERAAAKVSWLVRAADTLPHEWSNSGTNIERYFEAKVFRSSEIHRSKSFGKNDFRREAWYSQPWRLFPTRALSKLVGWISWFILNARCSVGMFHVQSTCRNRFGPTWLGMNRLSCIIHLAGLMKVNCRSASLISISRTRSHLLDPESIEKES